MDKIRFFFDDCVEIIADSLKYRLKILIFALRHIQEITDHLKDIDQYGSDLQTDEGHPVALPTIVGFLQFGHGLQGIVIGS